MSPQKFDTADDEGPSPALTPHQEGLIVGSPAPEAVARQTMTRRSWYTKTAAAEAFQEAVDNIHHATRTPKHEVVAALLEAAVAQSDRVRSELSHTSQA
ncbi:hypothetical protein ACIPW9_37000 [Streptomyces sp. NPDC090052]|uniref:hypothetical protein n=1 Tax=Streptomyces sp. NPDC090052 TaxID=3365931 RepID=UPI00381A9EFE